MTPINIGEITKPKMPALPYLLLHPNIPAGVAGLNPRSLFGQEWWDVTRKAAEEMNNHCCWACHIHKSDTYTKWLEGHEVYSFDYGERIALYHYTASICTNCHAFIHSGLLAQRTSVRQVSNSSYVATIHHGLNVLARVGLQPLPIQVVHMMQMCGWMPAKSTPRLLLQQLIDNLPKSLRETAVEQTSKVHAVIGMSDWRLIIDGREFTREDLLKGVVVTEDLSDEPVDWGSH